MLTENGIVHEQYKNIETMRPTRKISDKFQEILEGAIKNETD
jgi:hypothetical protein